MGIWHDDQTKVLREKLAEGLSCAKIAVIINEQFGTTFTRAAIFNRADRIKIPPANSAPLWSQEAKNKLLELYNEDNGLSFVKMAAEINAVGSTSFSRAAVMGQARRMGLKGKRQPDSDRVAKPRESKARVRIVSANGNSNAMRVMRAPPGETFKPRCVEIVPLHIGFSELEDGLCKYPYGDEPATMTFCGHPSVEGKSYCQPHAGLCWVIPQPVERKYTKFHGTDFSRRAS